MPLIIGLFMRFKTNIHITVGGQTPKSCSLHPHGWWYPPKCQELKGCFNHPKSMLVNLDHHPRHVAGKTYMWKHQPDQECLYIYPSIPITHVSCWWLQSISIWRCPRMGVAPNHLMDYHFTIETYGDLGIPHFRKSGQKQAMFTIFSHHHFYRFLHLSQSWLVYDIVGWKQFPSYGLS